MTTLVTVRLAIVGVLTAIALMAATSPVMGLPDAGDILPAVHDDMSPLGGHVVESHVR
ncbi:hypothetical protein [Demequina sp. NBRC 110051]|uniref:hypothetical protein n=1 Tax=Demequina sp. NBRC 110051 TaxID=1570340 RepID=UPI00135643DE|nr:hypothetical protein [Demequina sp. NBRC 110051]